MVVSRYRSITKALVEEIGISVALMKGSTRTQEVVYARMIFSYILKNREHKSEAEIAEFLNKDRAAIYHYLRQFEDEVKHNKRLNAMYTKILNRLGTKAKRVNVEDEVFASNCESMMVSISREYKFHPKRKWRFDFAIHDLKIAIEKEGGIWIGGRHNRAAGFIADMEKYNSAGSLGWIVLRATPSSINSEEFLNILHETIKMRKN